MITDHKSCTRLSVNNELKKSRINEHNISKESVLGFIELRTTGYTGLPFQMLF